jgi:hypothetical protein
MAGSDDRMVEVGMNEEQRLCRLAGDDDEDDMREDHEAMFGRIADDPISVDDAEDPSAPPLDGNSAKRSRPSASLVWDDKLFKNINGKTVTYGARCLHCSNEYSVLSPFPAYCSLR